MIAKVDGRHAAIMANKKSNALVKTQVLKKIKVGLIVLQNKINSGDGFFDATKIPKYFGLKPLQHGIDNACKL